MLRLPYHTFPALAVAASSTLLVLAVVLSSPMTSAGDGAVPPEAYDRLAAEGSVELILSVRNDDALSQAKDLAVNRGRGAAVDRLEQVLGDRLAAAVGSLPAGVTAIESYGQVGSAAVLVTTTEGLDALSQLPNVLRIDLSQVLEPALLQSLALIHQPEAVAAGHGGEGTSIAVLDTGVEYTREAFGYCTSPGVPATCRVAFAEDFTFFDDGQLDGGQPKHGTNVAGIAAGVAPSADILALDVFSGSTASDGNIIDAISWVVDNAATYNVKAVNLSIGTNNEFSPEGTFFGGCPTGLKSAFQALIAADVLPVVAAGNGASSSRISYPGCIAEAHTVGATYDASGVNGAFSACTDNPTVVDTVACFSNSHQTMLDSLAPGARISAAGLNNWAGTSMATPHVAAAAAILAAIPAVSVEDVQSILRETGPAITDPRNGVSKRRLDLEEAVVAAEVSYAAPTSATTADADADGYVDQIRLVFAENLNDDFSNFSVAVDGYTVEGVSSGTGGDTELIVNLDEGTEPDSAARPEVTIVTNESLATSSGNLVGPQGSAISANDGAGPAIASAQTVAKRTVVFNFSEAIDQTGLTKGDIKLFIEGSRRGIKKLVQIDEDTWEIFVRRAAKWAPGASGTLRFKAIDLVDDSAGNGNSQTASVAVTAGY